MPDWKNPPDLTVSIHVDDRSESEVTRRIVALATKLQRLLDEKAEEEPAPRGMVASPEEER